MSISELSEEQDISFPDEEDEGPNIGVSHKYCYFYVDFNFPPVEIHWRTKYAGTTTWTWLGHTAEWGSV